MIALTHLDIDFIAVVIAGFTAAFIVVVFRVLAKAEPVKIGGRK